MSNARPPLLERAGVRYFRRLSAAIGPVDVGDGVHYLNPREREALSHITILLGSGDAGPAEDVLRVV